MTPPRAQALAQTLRAECDKLFARIRDTITPADSGRPAARPDVQDKRPARPLKARSYEHRAMTASKFRVGDTVLAPWDNDEQYPAVVAAVGDGTCMVRWLDGDVARWVTAAGVSRWNGIVEHMVIPCSVSTFTMHAPAEPNGLPLQVSRSMRDNVPPNRRALFHVAPQLSDDKNLFVTAIPRGNDFGARAGGGTPVWRVERRLLQPVERAQHDWDARSKVSGRHPRRTSRYMPA